MTEKTFLTNDKTKWKLSVILKALEYLGNPQRKIENMVIHIAGTNGKGSTANFIKNSLEYAGYKVGLFTSPHLINYNERFYFNKRWATDEEIKQYKKEILTKCKNHKEISYFEATTLIAILLFSKMNLDYYIFEVGLGGRLDATNIFDKPLISVITSISYDHMDKLGNTLEEIAFEKGSIIKTDVPVFTSNVDTKIVNVLQKIADNKNTKLYCQNKDYQLDLTLKPSLLGNHQIINANLAKAVCKHIGVDDKYITQGIQNTNWPGRIQPITLKNVNNSDLHIKQIYLDGGHNEDGVKVLCDFAAQQQNEQTNIIGILSVLKRKDYLTFFPILQKTNFNKLLFYSVPEEINDFVEPEELCKIATTYNIPNDKITDFSQIHKYVDKSKNNIIFIFGSLYFVGYVLKNYVEK